MGLTLKVCLLVLMFIFMRIIHSTSISLSPRESVIDVIEDNSKYFDDSPEFITMDQRMKRCKETHPKYDFNKLTDDEIEEMVDNSKINPCRVDCIVYERDNSAKFESKVVYTEFFVDGKTKCGPKKVCKRLIAGSNVGTCQINYNLKYNHFT